MKIKHPVLLAIGGALLFAAALILLFVLSSKAPPLSLPPDPRAVAAERFYRSAYVLQRFGGPAAGESLRIPPAVIRADATESLLHHPDRIFVLSRVAEDLAALSDEEPRARLFEAYARLGLGDRRPAALLLLRYVAEAPYRASDYALLCSLLREQGDGQNLLLMGREWQERDPACRADRARYLVAACLALDRLAEAEAETARSAACLGWQALVCTAAIAEAAGKSAEARRLLEKLRREHGAAAVDAFWNQVRCNKEAFGSSP